jgi:hypothetical protein
MRIMPCRSACRHDATRGRDGKEAALRTRVGCCSVLLLDVAQLRGEEHVYSSTQIIGFILPSRSVESRRDAANSAARSRIGAGEILRS